MRAVALEGRPAGDRPRRQLLAAADLWLFVTSAARYADQVPWDFLRKAAERVARNTPIQGTAADIIKVAMVRIERALERRRRNVAEAQMLLTVHDELVFEAPPGEREALTTLVREEMGGAMKLDVPLVVQVGWGESWGAAK